MTDYYLLFKALHIIAVIAWMAALLYLPRLYVYHAGAAPDSELDSTLQTMERRLLRYIATPAMIATFLLGGLLIYITGALEPGNGWMHAKLTLVLLMAGFHGFCACWRKQFASGTNTRSTRFFRIANEVPTLLMVIIVLLAVLKPF